MAIKVTDILTRILTDQGRRTISGGEAVRRILEETRRMVMTVLADAPAGGFASWQLQQALDSINGHLTRFESAARSELTWSLNDAWHVGADLLPELAAAGGTRLGSFMVPTTILDQIKEFTWGKIGGLRMDAMSRIRAELTMGLLGQKTPHEITQAIAGTLESPGVFKSILERAEVITKTELGRTFSMAHQASLEIGMQTIPELEKMWLHAGHPKSPRIYHLHLNGDVKPVDQPFLVGNIAMMYPRDPKAPVSEIINCGCMHVAYMAAWGTKKEFLASWNKAQKAANTPKEK